MNIRAIVSTDYHFKGQTAAYHGKVRDVYTVNNELIVIATDRISAFDVILPNAIPYKGQVLNQLAAYFLTETVDIVPNWLLATPDPNVSIGQKLNPFKLEMVVRGGLVGHAWREYDAGKREICGVKIANGLQQYDMFETPIITPSTKEDVGHDEDISVEKIISTRLASAEEFEHLSKLALQLFARGQLLAAKQNLVLMDTKYEFGKDADGNIFLIDEIHTPDSSRYFYADSYRKYIADRGSEPPRHLSKEFVREWLMDNGFNGKQGQEVPHMSDELTASISERYIELFEQLSGQMFIKPDTSIDPLSRIESNVVSALKEL